MGRGLAPRVRSARRLGLAAPFPQLWRRRAVPEPARGTVGRDAAGSWAQAGGRGWCAPSAQRGSLRGRGPHKALLWLGDGRHRVAFVPPLTLWRARLIAGPGRGRVTCQAGAARREPPLARARAAE